MAAALMIAVVATPAPALALQKQGNEWKDDGDGDGDRQPDWDPARHYSDEGDHKERAMNEDDRVYRGSDGRYYCKRSDGTTGLVIGGLAGGVLGNIIAGGTLGTLLGAGGGALLGRKIDRDQEEAKCR